MKTKYRCSNGHQSEMDQMNSIHMDNFFKKVKSGFPLIAPDHPCPVCIYEKLFEDIGTIEIIEEEE